MQDRVPLYPGRVTLIPVAGQENTFDMVRADQPTQEGTPLNKATLLKDVTASILGLPNTAVPDDAFLALTIGVGTYGYRVKIQLADGTPVEGATVSGIEALTGSTLVSGADGIVLGKSTSKTVTISCTSPYIDQAPPTSQSVTAAGTITDVTLTLPGNTDTIPVSSSQIVKVSPMAKTMDVTAVGGGGGGGSGTDKSITWPGGGGGGGGYATTKTNITGVANQNLNITIGSGGAGGAARRGASGALGGTTSIMIGNVTVVTANGGAGGSGNTTSQTVSGGAGNGKGGDGSSGGNSAGANGTAHIFDNLSLGIAGGGGGGGGGYDATSVAGGYPNGGNGYVYRSSGGVHSGSDGKSFGGGGGGGGYNYAGYAGGAGGVYLRFHF